MNFRCPPRPPCLHAVWEVHEQVAVAAMETGCKELALKLVQNVHKRFPTGARGSRLMVGAGRLGGGGGVVGGRGSGGEGKSICRQRPAAPKAASLPSPSETHMRTIHPQTLRTPPTHTPTPPPTTHAGHVL